MDFNQVAVFIRVVQAGSFSAAARQLALPVSTVSHRVAMLEKRLGVTLLQRTTRRLHLTDAGQLYYQHASAGLARMLDAEAALVASSAEPGGVLRVTAPIDMGDPLLAAILLQMRSQWPRVRVELMLMNRYMDLVAEGVDVAIRTGELRDSTLVARKAGVACWAAYASPAYLAGAGEIASPEALRNHSCLQFSALGKTAWTLFSGPGSSITVPMAQHILVDDIGIVMTMVQAGGGVALLPDYLCRQHCADGTLVRVLPGWFAKQDPIHLVYPRQPFVSPALRAFLDVAHGVLTRWLE